MPVDVSAIIVQINVCITVVTATRCITNDAKRKLLFNGTLTENVIAILLQRDGCVIIHRGLAGVALSTPRRISAQTDGIHFSMREPGPPSLKMF